ncbi:MAG: FAD-dependent oxidoreductase [bacterium]|nr:FAD-dependent oxidoreductase [bacterium]
MARLEITRPSEAHATISELTQDLGALLTTGSMAGCPVEFAGAMVHASASQSCGKCVPCRIGLWQLDNLITQVLDGNGTLKTVEMIETLAESIYHSADCAVGYGAAQSVLAAVIAFQDDFRHHVRRNSCLTKIEGTSIPCISGCPANVDIPGYIALVGAGRYTDAVRLIRKDNPFVLACGLICEHPCELSCRRALIDDPINIRGLKRYAIEHASDTYTPFHYEKTDRKIAIIGGGPSGLTAAYYLALMGHEPTIFEQREHLGGMMRYGIPAYRLPRERLDAEIDFMVSQGIEVRLNTRIPDDISFEDLKANYDAIYVAIGAHNDNKLGIEGEDAEGVMSAVEMLREIGDGNYPDFSGERVAIIGGGNVAMDVARSSVRLGAESVTIVYRRRVEDMTAQREEIEGAIAEGCEILELHAPQAIATEDGKVVGLTVQRQIPGAISGGRPRPVAADCPPETIPFDRVLVAIGQVIDSEEFAKAGVATSRGRILGDEYGEVFDIDGVFVGGDCETGPATVIRAVAAGKVVARNIDDYLGYHHPIKLDVEVPPAVARDRAACGRSNMVERKVAERKDDFELMEKAYSEQEAMQEAHRCLRCDHFGMGAFLGGRSFEW